MAHNADIDLDFADRNVILSLIDHVPATQINNGKIVKHRSGVYVHTIPYNPSAGSAAIEYIEADERGYFKIDFLNVSVYKQIRDAAHYEELLAIEPPWHKLNDSEFVKQLIQIGNHHDKVAKKMPATIPQLAMFLSIIRPAKSHLQTESWNVIAQTVWDRPTDGSYAFKKAHAVAYAMLVALHMNIINQAS